MRRVCVTAIIVISSAAIVFDALAPARPAAQQRNPFQSNTITVPEQRDADPMSIVFMESGRIVAHYRGQEIELSKPRIWALLQTLKQEWAK